MLMAVKILEEALCIKSVLSDKFSEFINDALNICPLNFSGWRSTIDDVSAT